MYLPPVILGECHEGEHVLFGVAHHGGEFREPLAQGAYDLTPLGDGGLMVLLYEGGATRLQEERQITAIAEFGDRQGNGAGSGLPGSLAIAIAVVGTLCVTLAVASAAKPIHLQRHQTVGSKRDHLA